MKKDYVSVVSLLYFLFFVIPFVLWTYYITDKEWNVKNENRKLQKYLKDNIKLFVLIKYSENNNGYRQCIAGSILGKNSCKDIQVKLHTVHAVLSDVFWLVHRFEITIPLTCLRIRLQIKASA